MRTYRKDFEFDYVNFAPCCWMKVNRFTGEVIHVFNTVGFPLGLVWSWVFYRWW